MLPASSPNKFVILSKPVPDASVTTILVGVIVVAALYFGREVLVPIALAILLSFILSPCVRLLQRVKFPRIVSVIGGRGGGVFSDFWAGDIDGLSSEWSRQRSSRLPNNIGGQN